MARKQSEELAARWRAVLRRQVESGRSIRGFCASEGISEPSFYAWRKRLREQDGMGQASSRITTRRKQRDSGPSSPRPSRLPKATAGSAPAKRRTGKRASNHGVPNDGASTNDPSTSGASNTGSLFVPIKLLDTPATLKIIHPRGYQIEVSGEVNPVALRQVLDALDQRRAP